MRFSPAFAGKAAVAIRRRDLSDQSIEPRSDPTVG